jgi:hypothetical protein
MSQLNFEHYKGDTFKEVPFEIKINNVEIDLTGAIVKMQLRKEYGGVVGLTLTSVASAGITITDASNGKFKINNQIINIEAFNYIYDIEIHFLDNTVSTWVKGNFLITNDVTR